MWQRDAVVGGTPSIGPGRAVRRRRRHRARHSPDIPSPSACSTTPSSRSLDKDYITIRNEWWKDTDGERSGLPGVYTSHAIGLSHNFTRLSPDPSRNRLLPQLDASRRSTTAHGKTRSWLGSILPCAGSDCSDRAASVRQRSPVAAQRAESANEADSIALLYGGSGCRPATGTWIDPTSCCPTAC